MYGNTRINMPIGNKTNNMNTFRLLRISQVTDFGKKILWNTTAVFSAVVYKGNITQGDFYWTFQHN